MREVAVGARRGGGAGGGSRGGEAATVRAKVGTPTMVALAGRAQVAAATAGAVATARLEAALRAPAARAATSRVVGAGVKWRLCSTSQGGGAG